MSTLNEALMDQAATMLFAVTLQSQPIDNATTMLLLDQLGQKASAELQKFCQEFCEMIVRQLPPETRTANQTSVPLGANTKYVSRDDWVSGHLVPGAREIYQYYDKRFGPLKAAKMAFEWVAEQYGFVDIDSLQLGPDGLTTVYQEIEAALGVKKP